MPSNVTEHYQLNQWEAGDRVLRTDFNADNAKIDAALAGLAQSKADASALAAMQSQMAAIPKVATGSYVGTGEHGGNKPTFLTFPFVPKLVIIVGAMSEGSSLGTVLIQGQRTGGGIGVSNNSAATHRLTVTWSEKTVTWFTSADMAEYQMNRQNTTYYYFAIG